MSSLDRAAELLADRNHILVFTGAGISTESGIPDFRGPDGLWKKMDPSEFTIRRFRSDPEFRIRLWERRFTEARPTFEPNAGHTAVTDLWKLNLVIGCATQNVDGLHQRAGLPDDAVAELHGNAFGIACADKGHLAEPDDVRKRWADGDVDPRCDQCGSLLKSTVVWFGEDLPVHTVDRARAWSDVADAVVAIGSTMSVYPAAELPLDVASRGEPFVIINQGPTDHDRLANVKVEGKAGDMLPALVARLRSH